MRIAWNKLHISVMNIRARNEKLADSSFRCLVFYYFPSNKTPDKNQFVDVPSLFPHSPTTKRTYNCKRNKRMVSAKMVQSSWNGTISTPPSYSQGVFLFRSCVCLWIFCSWELIKSIMHFWPVAHNCRQIVTDLRGNSGTNTWERQNVILIAGCERLQHAHNLQKPCDYAGRAVTAS